ncbi:hypothetical protein PT974_00804 [Cladobotryum mycophilum]|uniref:Family c-likeg-protein-coupled receptor protein n=1 Tax=Cladobotryum mycophilum TaxID=491253 RepID=A0ABR0T1W2_9HYPO
MSSPPSNGSSPASSPPPGPPYPPRTAGLGGVPTPSVDDPISAVILIFFVASAAFNMTILQLNKRRGHKFILSGLLFGFSMARITANVMRIVWASYPHNARIAIAAQIFINAGVILLFAVNLIFTQRVVRAYHPHIGWSRIPTYFFRFLYFSIFACFVMLITAVVYSFYTLNVSTLNRIHNVQLFAIVYLAILAFLPTPIVAICLVLPRRGPIERFGTGRMRTKLFLLVFTSLLLSFSAGFRAGVSFVRRPLDDPAWFHHKAAFYCVNYLIEIICVYSYALSRFDRRFHIPNGSSAPGHYVNGVPGSEKAPIPLKIPMRRELQALLHSNPKLGEFQFQHGFKRQMFNEK